MTIEYDIIYIKPQDIEIFLLQIPHQLKSEDNQQLLNFMKIKKILYKQNQKKFQFIYEILENLTNFENKQDDLIFESKCIYNRQNLCAASVDHQQKIIFLFPIFYIQQLRKRFQDNLQEKEEILKQSEELIKKRNINKHFDTQIQQYKFQKEILESENYQSLEINDSQNRQQILNELLEIPRNLKSAQALDNQKYIKDLLQ